MTKRSVSTAIIAVTLLLVGCVPQGSSGPDGRAGDAGPAAPKRITAAIQGDPSTLSSAINSAGAGRARGVSEVEMLLHAGLSTQDNQRAWVPQLAEAVPSTANGLWTVLPDGRMETTWRIREGARWHDGTSFTTDDLVFTTSVGQDRSLTFLGHPGYELIEGVDVRDARNLTVRWSRPFIQADGMFSYLFALPLPKHLLEKPYAEDKGNFLEVPYWTTDFVGLGPYRLRDFVRGSHLTLQAYDQYPLGRPKIDTIEVKFILDLNTYVANMLAGEVDLSLGRSLALDQAALLKERWSAGTVIVQPTTSWTALYPQHVAADPPVLADVQFRRALLHALDRQQIVDVLQYGLVPVAHSMISPATVEYREVERSIVRYDYDPRRAGQLIEGLGYTRGPDGAFRDAGGQRLSVEVRTTGGDDFRDKVLFTVADYWQRAGVPTESLTIPRQRADDREYRVTRPAFEIANQPVELRGLVRFHSREMPTPQNSFRGSNRSRYESPELDALIDRFTVTIPLPERNEVLAQIIRHMTERLVVLDLYYAADVTAFVKRLTNIPVGDPWNAHEWDLL